MKIVALLFASWLLVMGGAVLVISSTSIPLSALQPDLESVIAQGSSLLHAVPTMLFDRAPGARLSSSSTSLLRAVPTMLLGVLGIFCGVHLRQLTLRYAGVLPRPPALPLQHMNGSTL